MPAKLEFNTGMIAYNRGERELGVFRYPRDEKGLFVAPYPLKKLDDFRKLDPEDMKKLLNRKEPLVFEAYKIPQYGFEIIDVNNLNIREIANITDIDFAMSIKGEHDRLVGAALEETKQKINSSPNYLLILINVLNCHWKNLEEVACATNRIIHI
jgi:hypothetical protein